MSENRRFVPSNVNRIETIVARSRFIATVSLAESVDDAKLFLKSIKEEMPDASHHVYAFRVGHGNSITEGMSDDGEPTGTAGPPVLAVLRGSAIGDIIVVVTRYFGGTKLGTGGLVRAYSEAASVAIKSTEIEEKIEKRLVGFDCSYSLYEQVKRLIEHYSGVIGDETFTSNVSILATFPLSEIDNLCHDLKELSAGRIEPVIFDAT